MDVDARSATPDAAAPRELHIAGVVIYAQSDRCDVIIASLRMLAGAQIHASTPDGRLVVTLEAARSSLIEEQLSAINALAGVLSSALVYQHHEDIESLNEEIVDGTDTSRVH